MSSKENKNRIKLRTFYFIITNTSLSFHVRNETLHAISLPSEKDPPELWVVYHRDTTNLMNMHASPLPDSNVFLVFLVVRL